MAAPFTLEELNTALVNAKVSELSKDKVYLIVFDQKQRANFNVAGKILAELADMGVRVVGVFAGEGEAIRVYSLDQIKADAAAEAEAASAGALA